MTDESPDTRESIEDHQKWQLAQQIVEDNTGFLKRILADTRDRPATSVAMAFGVGLIIGLVVRRR